MNQPTMEVLRDQLAANPNDPAVLDQVGLQLLAHNQPQMAHPLFRQAVELTAGHNARILFHHALCVNQLGCRNEAAALLQQALRLEPEVEEYQLALARTFQANAQSVQALEHLLATLRSHPNSDQAWDEFKSAHERVLREGEAVRFNNYGPIVICSQVHSAGNYIAAQLRSRLRISDRPSLTADEYGCIIADRLEAVIRHGGLVLNHLEPTLENRIILRQGGLKKLVVTVRDPRQCLYSTTVWYDHCYERSKSPDWNPYEHDLMRVKMPAQYWEWSFEKKIDYMINTELGHLVRWLEGWVEAKKNPATGVEIHFARHDDMKADAESFFQEIVMFLGIPVEALSGEVTDSRPGSNGALGEHAFRAGRNDEWREKLLPRQVESMCARVPSELLKYFGWS